MDNNKSYKSISQKKDLYCINCGKEGHMCKNCNEAVTSYGIILLLIEIDKSIKDVIINELDNIDYDINIMNVNENNIGITINDPIDIELFCKFKSQIRFLLIRRKHTLGFLEFIRGRYSIDNIDGIIFLFKQMTLEEINKIKNTTFDKLWDEVWGLNKNNATYQNEYAVSKDKFNKLKNEDNGFLNLNFYVENVIPNWTDAEWGFPKGRRNFKETNESCAIREFKEESGFDDDEIIILNSVNPIEEKFIGTNGVNYKHIYYLAISDTDKIPSININNLIQTNEIGDIGYFSYEEAIKKIRPYHVDRHKIIIYSYIFMINNIIKNVKNMASLEQETV